MGRPYNTYIRLWIIYEHQGGDKEHGLQEEGLSIFERR